MLTSFLKNSRPGNLLLLTILLILSFFVVIFRFATEMVIISYLIKESASGILIVFALFLFNFIIQKNKITGPSGFGIFLFTIFWLLFPTIFLSHKILIANVFLLLALRRILSLGKDSNPGKKIVDTGIWITAASLFYFWSWFFLIPMWIAIFRKPNRHYKELLMPFVGIAAVLVITTSFLILRDGSLTWFKTWVSTPTFDFQVYNQKDLLIPTTIFFGFLIWTAATKFLRFPTYSLKERPAQSFLLYLVTICTLIAFMAPTKTGAEMFFILPPAAIITAHFFEEGTAKPWMKRNKAEFWFKELLLWLLIITAAWTIFF